MSDRRAYELMSAASVVSAMADSDLPAPTSERQARELAKVPEPERAEVWEKTIDRTGGKPTAAASVVTDVTSEGLPAPTVLEISNTGLPAPTNEAQARESQQLLRLACRSR